LANERLEGGLVNFFSFVNIDRPAHVSVETRVEETGRILERRALGEGKLHDILVGLAAVLVSSATTATQYAFEDRSVRFSRSTPITRSSECRSRAPSLGRGWKSKEKGVAVKAAA
jgi:hypothetical protein